MAPIVPGDGRLLLSTFGQAGGSIGRYDVYYVKYQMERLRHFSATVVVCELPQKTLWVTRAQADPMGHVFSAE